VKISILGTRGIPARYGGFETFAEELSRRLVARGHDVSVYCRQKHPSPTYLGVELRYLPTIRHKYLDTVAHTFLSTLHLTVHRADAALYCNAANAFCIWIPRVLGMPVALNVDGLERNRKKWNLLGQAWYRMSEWLSTKFPNSIVTDAEAIRTYYRETYAKESTMIPYGADPVAVSSQDVLTQLSLRPRSYFLYVSRLEPENNALLVRESFEQLADSGIQLALIGDAPYASEYIRQVRSTQDPRIVMPGAIYGVGYAELQSHCFAYIHATEVGGTHPALIEAMGRGALVLYLDTPENAEVAGGCGIPFTVKTLPEVLRESLAMSSAEREQLQRKARQRVEERYSWEAVTDRYEELLKHLCAVG
jgi:glycosyltransferase involved in cell wall biosynthesis